MVILALYGSYGGLGTAMSVIGIPRQPGCDAMLIALAITALAVVVCMRYA